MVLEQIILAIWIMLPAYTSNGLAPLSGKLKKTHPMDFNKKLNKHRILGDGKTWEGFIIGVACGTIVGIILSFFTEITVFLGFIIAVSALIGDLIGSFIKRRLDLGRGGKAPLLDQLDFMIFVIVFTYVLIDYTLIMVGFMLILTYLLHRATSIIGYKMNIKREPW